MSESSENILKEYLFKCGFLLEHNEAFEKMLQKLGESRDSPIREIP